MENEKPKPVLTEGQCILQALKSLGADRELDAQINDTGNGVYDLLGQTPLTLLCDMVAKKLNEQGYRVTKHSENRKRRN